jgi:hypothetical protein
MSDFFAGAAAAITGGVVTGVAAWVAALVVERRRENLQLIGAIEMLRDEVDENADRFEKDDNALGLTLGVWEHCKPTLAGIGRRAIDKDLWADLHRAYREIYEARAGPYKPTLTKEGLTSISTQLAKALKAFERERHSPRYWLRPERNRRR